MPMKAEKTLLPGQAGTRRLVEQYGDDLLYVRYRYDAKQDATVKTVELIIERRPRRRGVRSIPKNKVMPLRVEYGEVKLGRQIRAAGGYWNRKEQVWKLAYDKVVALGLVDRIIAKVSMKTG
jgi:hypothetical protein